MNYFDELIKINKTVCGNEFGIRKDFTYFDELNNIIDNTIKDNNNSYDNVVYKSLNVASVIKLLQPFYDGNNRTAIIYFGNLLNDKGYEFDYDSALYDMSKNNLVVPIIYSEEESISKSSIDLFDKYIVKHELAR